MPKIIAESLEMANGGRNVTVNFYPQTMSESEMEKAFNYVDKRFGMAL